MATRPNPATAVKKLIHQDKEWDRFFVLSCEYGPARLTSQARQWQAELEDRGQHFAETEIQDALLDLAAELLPDSPAGSEEAMWEAKRELLTRALYWLGALGQDQRGSCVLDADEVGRAHARPLGEFRAWLRERCREAKGALAA